MPDAPINDLLSRAVGAHRAGDLATAAAGYQSVLIREPDNVDAAHYLGMVEYQRGELAAAATRVGGAARARPQDPAILANLGLIQLAAGQLDPAARAVSASLRLAPDQPEAWHTLGLVRQRQGQTAHAVQCHRRALELAPGHRAARLALVRSLIGDDELCLALGETLDRAGDPDRAAAELRALADRSPAARGRALTREPARTAPRPSGDSAGVRTLRGLRRRAGSGCPSGARAGAEGARTSGGSRRAFSAGP